MKREKENKKQPVIIRCQLSHGISALYVEAIRSERNWSKGILGNGEFSSFIRSR